MSLDLPPAVSQQLKAAADGHPHPLIFATISGAHLYGFPSPDSDYDLRGSHILPLKSVVGLDPPAETVEVTTKTPGLELDLVTHDVRKFFGLMLKKNGYVLEQVLSPLIVSTSPEHAELKEIARACVTRHHAHHYLGFASTQWRLFEKERPRRIKPLLYVYRVLLTGLHLMRTGNVEANLRHLNAEARLTHVDELIQRKVAGSEQGQLDAHDVSFHEQEFQRLFAELEAAQRESGLPEVASAHAALDDLLVRIRLRTHT